MSNLGSIHTYRSEVDKIIRYGGSSNETTIRRATVPRPLAPPVVVVP